MQIIDLPDTARMAATASGQDPGPSGEWVLMTRKDFDGLLVRLLLAQADPEDEAMQLLAAAAHSEDLPA